MLRKYRMGFDLRIEFLRPIESSFLLSVIVPCLLGLSFSFPLRQALTAFYQLKLLGSNPAAVNLNEIN
uniref:Uncharacterized protein n=1 Tax=Utricularia reniformis TaxID=192314 RepID=A0A1Y0B399_9LAMI|nr:hypothetical protein AEK19_MT1681 [Utricularia reniformis]ART31863.1 hypothetical protein AEK19_MT1681 [Utricularia reniformis]